MSETTEFHWDSEHCAQKNALCNKLFFGLLGLALMVMMMDLGSPYLLGPALVAIFALRRAQYTYDRMELEFSDASIKLAPRSLLIRRPASANEQRINYREINQIESFKRWGISGVSLTLASGEQLQLPGFGQACYESLSKAALAEKNSDSGR
ncbi:hypothetical protein [Marinobacterium arenosum]|uniref:hypothetical protein n=1 Tax=Marinobacterium arenosum TaxID=2862496 RepID=UPI001C9651AF|nr:hypothetical protein [Marinobacterium arenosum]MBY4676299.1 hypothetical protein [Marinobacterium arenosum]